jgi:hypothetical protein
MVTRIEIAIEFCDRADQNVSYPAIHFASGLQTTGSLAVLPRLSFRPKNHNQRHFPWSHVTSSD